MINEKTDWDLLTLDGLGELILDIIDYSHVSIDTKKAWINFKPKNDYKLNFRVGPSDIENILKLYANEKEAFMAITIAKKLGFEKDLIEILTEKKIFDEAAFLARHVGMKEKANELFIEYARNLGTINLYSYLQDKIQEMRSEEVIQLLNSPEEIYKKIYSKEIKPLVNKLGEKEFIEKIRSAKILSEKISMQNYRIVAKWGEQMSLAKKSGCTIKILKEYNIEKKIYETAKLAKSQGLEIKARELFNQVISLYEKECEYIMAAEVFEEEKLFDRAFKNYEKERNLFFALSTAEKNNIFDKAMVFAEQIGNFQKASEYAEKINDEKRLLLYNNIIDLVEGFKTRSNQKVVA